MDALQSLHDALLSELNPEIWSTDTAKSILFLIFGFGMTVFVFKTLKKAICWWIGLIFFMEIMHFVAFQTVFGMQFPLLQEVFKYDVLSMLAQVCVGTKLCSILLYARAFLEATIGAAVTAIYNFGVGLIEYMKAYTPFFNY